MGVEVQTLDRSLVVVQTADESIASSSDVTGVPDVDLAVNHTPRNDAHRETLLLCDHARPCDGGES